jgi:hypothetical protein
MISSHGKDIKNATLSKFCLAGTATAAGTGDATLITGDTINIATLAARPASVVFEIAGRAVLTATKSLAVTALVEASVDGTTWTTLVASATVLTLTSTGGGTETGVGRIGVDLISSDLNYIRLKATPDLSHTGTDTAIVAAVAVFAAPAKT